MKKIIRILGVTLTLLVVASCSKDEAANGEDTTLKTENLSHKYKFLVAAVEIPVDLDNNDISSQNLIDEKVNQCSWDNILEITNDRFILTDEGEICDKDSSSKIIIDARYVLNTEAATMKLYDEKNNLIESFTGVRIGFQADGRKYISFDSYDSKLQQMVKYMLIVTN